MFGQDRKSLRAMYREAWRKHIEGKPQSDLEVQISSVVALHPEYHAWLQDDASDDRDFDDATGNPFLHMGLHLALDDQLKTNRPAGIRAIHDKAVERFGDAHQVQHGFMECLGKHLWDAQKNGRNPDEAAYLDDLRRQFAGKGAT